MNIYNFNINSTNYVSQMSYGSSYNYSYGFYALNAGNWTSIGGTFDKLLTGSDGNYNLYTSCAMNESSPLILDTVARLGLAKGINLQGAPLRAPYDNSGSVYFGFNGSWYNSQSPGNYVSLVNGSSKISGNTLATPSNGFYSVTLTNSYTLAEVYFNHYPQNCSKVFK